MKHSDVFKPKNQRHTMPEMVERDESQPETIIGTVKQVRNWSVLLWDCPEQKWYSLPNQAQADLMRRCQEENIKVRVTVRGSNVERIEI